MQTFHGLSSEARALEREGRFAEAAPLFERSGDINRAIESYTKGEQFDRAADLLRLTGKGMAAAELYESIGQHLKAAAVYEGLFEFAPAAAALVRAGDPARAAVLYEQADAFAEAAELYAALGNLPKAVQLFERAGLLDRAEELRGAATPQVAPQPAEPQLDLSAGGYYDAHEVIAALVQLLRSGRADDAARLYGSCQENIGYAVLAAIAGDTEAEQHSARMFVLANDFPLAAELFENLGDFQSAAEMYERADDPYLAAEMYVRVGDVPRAAEMYEKGGHNRQAAEAYANVGNLDKAAACYEKSGDCFLAGRLYVKLGKPGKAIELLQKVRPTEAGYFEACRWIGEALAAGGRPDLAAQKLEECTRHAEVSGSTLALFSLLGRLYEHLGDPARARAVFERILAFDPGNAEAAERMRRLAAPAPAALPCPPAVVPPRPPPAAGLVSMMDGFEFLKSTPMFSALSLDEMKAVYQACELRRFAPGEVLIEQDQPGTALFVLRRGSAQVLRIAPGKQELLARLEPGSPVGEMALIDDAPTSARVVAETEVEAFCITRRRFELLLASSDATALKLYRFFVQTLAKRLRATSIGLAGAAAGLR